jgi:hypothetical protein
MKVYTRNCPDPVIVTINLGKAEKAGITILAFSNQLYMAKELKPEVLSGPPIPPKPEQGEGKTSHKADTPGSPLGFTLVPTVHHGKKKGKFQDAPDWKVRTRIDRRKDKD